MLQIPLNSKKLVDNVVYGATLSFANYPRKSIYRFNNGDGKNLIYNHKDSLNLSIFFQITYIVIYNGLGKAYMF